MQLDQNTQQDREKCILEAVKAIETSLKILTQNAEAPQKFFTAALDEVNLASITAAGYLRDMAKLTGDDAKFDARTLKLSNLSYMTNHLDRAREEIAQGIAGQTLSDFFRAGVKRCDNAIAETTKLVDDTVRKGNCIIQFEKACLGSAAEKPVKQQAARPGWMKLVVDNTL